MEKQINYHFFTLSINFNYDIIFIGIKQKNVLFYIRGGKVHAG